MAFSRRSVSLAGLFLLAIAVVFAACADRDNPLLPEKPETPVEPGGKQPLAALQCTGSVRDLTVTCAAASPGAGGASALIVGGQHEYVTVATSNIQKTADTLAFDLTLKNLIPQALGTMDGTTLDPSGIRIFFHSGPVPSGPGSTGIIEVANEDGAGAFTNGSQPYFQYNEVLDTDETSLVKVWKLRYDPTVTGFSFTLYVSAAVRFPDGWVEVTPDTTKVVIGQLDTLKATVRNPVGKPLPNQDIDWSSSNPAAVSVTPLPGDSLAVVEGLQSAVVTITASTTSPPRTGTAVVISNDAPVTPGRAYNALGNVTLPVDAAHGLLIGATDPNPGATLSVVADSVTTSKGGTAILASNGSFTYRPPADSTGTVDSFIYRVTDGVEQTQATATVNLQRQFWFVDPANSAAANGTQAAPFPTLRQAALAAGEADSIFVKPGTTAEGAGAVLKNNQVVIGAGVAASITARIERTVGNAADSLDITLLAAGARPALGSATSTVTLASGNTLRGLTLSSSGGGTALTGSNFGLLTMSQVGVASSGGAALNLSTGNLAATLDSVSSSGSPGNGASLSTLTGSLTVNGGTISNPTGAGVDVNGGSATIAWGGALSTGSGRPVLIQNVAGGSVTVSGAVSSTALGIQVQNNSGGNIVFSGATKTLSTGANPAVSLVSNTGAAITFGGFNPGAGLQITTTTGTGFNATLGGTIDVDSAANDVSTAGGTAVNVVGTSIGTGLVFRSVSAVGGTSGIVLTNPGSGAFRVFGTGAAGSGGTIQNTTGDAVALSGTSSVTLEHMTIKAAGSGGGNAGITGSSFGTLSVDLDSVAASSGPALDLSNGSVSGSVGNLASAGSAAQGVRLNLVGGSFSVGGGSVANAGGAGVEVTGGAVSVTFGNGVSQTANNVALVSVAGNHTGTLAFNGTLSATAGTGLQFNDADGTYNFNGTATLAGGDAGVDIGNGSEGTFDFGTGVTITNPSGTAFSVNGSTPHVTYSGGITKGSAGLLVDVSEVGADSITFQTGTLSATAGDGILLSNADGSVRFDGTTTLNGGNAGVDVIGGSTGSLSFANVGITNPTGPALFVDASAPTTLSVAGSISTGPGSGRPVHIEDVTGGSITVSASIGSTGNGILAQNNTGGTITFSGSKTLSTGANTAVTLATNAGATINFTGGNLGITATTGTGISATAGGILNVTGSSNTVSTGTGTALNLNGVTVGASHLAFDAVSATGATNAVLLTSVTGTGSINVTGGAITGVAGGAPFVVSGGSVDASWAGSISQAANNALLSVSGGHTGDLAFTGALSATNGTGLQFDNADGNYDFTGTTTLNNTVAGGNAGVDVLNGSAGDFHFDADVDITNPTGPALFVDASAPDTVDFLGDISTGAGSGRPVHIEDLTGGFIRVSGVITTTGQGILVQNNTSGSPILTFSGTKNLNTGANAAFTLDNNDAAAINVGTAAMSIATTSGAGFRAVNGGTVNVTGTTNDVTTTTGTAVTISGTTIGGSGARFRTVSANGAANGIFLSGTGSTAGAFFRVDGTGTAGSGGAIVNTTGADGATGGNGVYLNDARNVTLNWMALSGHANNGIYGTGVRGLTVDKVRITGNNGTSNSGTFSESAVHLANLGGAVKFSGSRFDGGAYNAVRVDNSSGTAPALDSLVFVNDTVATMQGSTADVRGSALLVSLLDGTADVRFRDNRVLAWWSTGIHVLTQGTSSGTARITNNFVDNTNGALAGAMGIVAAGCRLGFNISGNTVRHTNGAAISTDMSPGCVNTVQGTIDGNFIGVSGDANSGSATGVAIAAGGRAGTTTVKISNNVLRQINGSASGAITLVAGDALAFGGSGTMNATVTGNNIQESGTTVNNAQHGILVTHGAQSGPPNDTHQGCYDILNNTIINFVSGTANNRIRVNQRFGTTSRFPGYTGAATGVTSQTDLASYLLGRNTASTSTNANTSTGGFLNTVPAGSACPQPSM